MFSARLNLLNEVCSITLKRGIRYNKSNRRKEAVRGLSDDDDFGDSSKPSAGDRSAKNGAVPSADELPDDKFEPLTAENQHERLACALTPLHSLPYAEQLALKWRRNRDALQELGKMLVKNRVPVKLRTTHELPCELKPIVPSPVTESYRNKDEFRINVGIDGNPKTVGFMVGNFADGTARCVGADEVIITKERHKAVARHFQRYIRKSPLRACDLFKDGGHWRGIAVRSNQKGDIMASVVMHPQSLTESEIVEQKNLLASYFEGLDDCKISSMYFQTCPHRRCTDTPHKFVFGEKHIYEELLGLKFRISPGSFFQVNTLAAERLYSSLIKLSDIGPNSIVLDICSGTGTISLVLAPHVRAVVGVEENLQAVQDANKNATLNNIKNATFFHGRAELVIPSLMSTLRSTDVTAILNPTQSGIGTNVIRTLRNCKELRRLIYISCKPESSALFNFIALCRPKGEKMSGTPFRPKLAVPLDMFPHTEHSELIMVFEKAPEEDVDRSFKM